MMGIGFPSFVLLLEFGAIAAAVLHSELRYRSSFKLLPLCSLELPRAGWEQSWIRHSLATTHTSLKHIPRSRHSRFACRGLGRRR